MRDLAVAQEASGRFAGVGIAVVTDSTWPDEYRREITKTSVAFYESSCPQTFGTAAFLYQRIRQPDFRRWVTDLAERSQTKRVVLHFHNAWLSGVFLPLPSTPGIQTGAVATFHGVNEHFQGKPVRRLLHRWMAQRLLTYHAALTSVDGLNTGVAERLFGIPRSSFTVIPNGLQPTDLKGGPALDVPGRPLTIGHVGSMIHQKGWSILADAAERLNRTSVQVRVILAGRGPEEQAAAAWAQRHAGWATFLGFVSNPREHVLPRLDVLCLMSQWEGLPMSILEAMSLGIPVIATDVGGVTEAVRHAETGLVIPRTAEALVAALEELIAHRDRRFMMGQQARRQFLEHFTVNSVIDRYATVYRRVLS
jgi:glycosyltransferase involved in cell wall biosynthesis